MSKKKKTLEQLLDEVDYVEDTKRNVVFTKLGSLIRTQKGKKPKELIEFKKSENFVPYVNIDLMSGANKNEIQYADTNGNVVLCNEQDVLMVWDGARSGFVGRGVSGIIGSTLSKIESPLILNDYLYQFLKFQFEYLNKNTKGSGIPHVDPLVLNEIEIPLYSLSEQKRIADKIEILFSKIDEAKVLIEEAKETSELRMAAILNGLFQKNVESVSGKSEKGIEPYRLPIGWQWKKLSDIGTLKRGKSKHRPRNDARLFGGPYPFIQTGDVAKAEKYIDSYTQTLSEFGLAQSALFEKGTLCITIAANIADTALLNFDSCFPDSVVGFYSDHEYISNEYIHYYISTIKQELEHYAPATAQKNINLKVLNEVLVPIPPYEEFLKIIEVINKLELKERSIFYLIDLEVHINQLKQSILLKAFKGELGTTDPTDESAIELLKSILQEKL